jgi:hypothetical protein
VRLRRAQWKPTDESQWAREIYKWAYATGQHNHVHTLEELNGDGGGGETGLDGPFCGVPTSTLVAALLQLESDGKVALMRSEPDAGGGFDGVKFLQIGHSKRLVKQRTTVVAKRASSSQPWGLRLQEAGGKHLVAHVDVAGAAEDAGVVVGAYVVSIDGVNISAAAPPHGDGAAVAAAFKTKQTSITLELEKEDDSDRLVPLRGELEASVAALSADAAVVDMSVAGKLGAGHFGIVRRGTYVFRKGKAPQYVPC